MKKIILENLTKDGVNIVIITLESVTVEQPKWEGTLPDGVDIPEQPKPFTEDRETERWRVALQNTEYGRRQIKELLASDYPEQYTEVMKIWGDTATIIMPEPEPMPSLPEDGIFWMTNPAEPKSIAEMTGYISLLQVDETDVLQGSHHVNDTRVIPVLIQMIQDLTERVDKLERKITV